MTARRIAAAICICVALGVAAVVGWSQGTSGRTYRSPEEVFRAFQEAAAKDDRKAICACLTEDSLDAMAGTMTLLLPSLLEIQASFADGKEAEKIKETAKQLPAVFARHGLSKEILDKTNRPDALKEIGPNTSREAKMRYFKKIASLAKDRNAFLVDLMGVLKQLQDGSKAMPALVPAEARLVEVQVNGNSAQGTLIVKTGERETREPIDFQRVDGGWKIDLLPPLAGSAPGDGEGDGEAGQSASIK